MNILSCVKPVVKKSNKGLATFDKKNYFPLQFVENFNVNNKLFPQNRLNIEKQFQKQQNGINKKI